MAKKMNLDTKEIKSAIMDRLEDQVDKYIDDFRSKSPDGKALPTINDIEALLVDLRAKTREIYLDMVSEMISSYDESEIIASKKENSKRKG